jgi:hypothetical protein
MKLARRTRFPPTNKKAAASKGRALHGRLPGDSGTAADRSVVGPAVLVSTDWNLSYKGPYKLRANSRAARIRPKIGVYPLRRLRRSQEVLSEFASAARTAKKLCSARSR